MPEVMISTHLLHSLEEPFEVIPLEIALGSLAKLVEGEFDDLWERYEDVAPRFRDVGLECGIEAISILFGAGFVAAQAVINRTVATLEQIRREVESLVPERTKHELRCIAARSCGSERDIPGINTLANYFKHNGEWPQPWGTCSKAQNAVALGLTWNNPDNMLVGAHALGFGGRDGLSRLAERLGEWRQELAAVMKRRAEIAATG